MLGIVGPKDFLAQCYQMAELIDVIGQFINQFLTLFGLGTLDIRGACIAVYTAIGGT